MASNLEGDIYEFTAYIPLIYSPPPIQETVDVRVKLLSLTSV
jgi:hypothetical protein